MIKTLSGVVIALAAILATAPRVSAQFCDINLLVNPGCDEPLVGGEIPGWVEIRGADWTCRASNPSPSDGPGYFFAGSADTAELVQVVNVADYWAHYPFQLRARMRTGVETPSDVARVIFEFRDTANELLVAFDSGDVVSPGGWTGMFTHKVLPPGTENIYVRLFGIQHGAVENNTYFDSVEVYPVCGLPVEPSTWGEIKGMRYQAP